MPSKKMEKALNKQLNAELYSAYIYAAMGAYFESKSLEGFAHWMNMQCQEEVVHAQKFYKYINDANGRVILDAIAKPPVDFPSALKVFEETLKHEKYVTSLIHKLVDLARSESDHATESFLQWFVNEQVEEEATANRILDQLKLVGDGPQGLFMLDREMVQRGAPGASEA